MKNIYKVMKDQHQNEVNNFPMFFAFNNKQFEEGMQSLNLDPSETDKVYSAGAGGYYKKTDAEKLHAMVNRHREEMEKAMLNEQFVYDMFDYELGNHEYTYTGSITDTLDALGLTFEEVNNNNLLSSCLERACKDQREWYSKHG